MLAHQKGLETAFEVLYRRHEKRVYGFLFGKLKNPQWVDEAFQMTFMKLHQARHRYDSTLPFIPWLFTLSRNAMIDLLRAQNRIQRQEELNPIAVGTAQAEGPKETLLILGLEALSVKHRKARLLQLSVVALLSMTAFVCTGLLFLEGLALFWALGSVLGGLITLELGWAFRSWMKSAYVAR